MAGAITLLTDVRDDSSRATLPPASVIRPLAECGLVTETAECIMAFANAAPTKTKADKTDLHLRRTIRVLMGDLVIPLCVVITFAFIARWRERWLRGLLTPGDASLPPSRCLIRCG